MWGTTRGNVSQETFDEHQNKKNAGFQLKENDKLDADIITAVLLTADTESLLVAPLNYANAMFFRSKLNLHNLTFYNLKDKEVMNFVWSEVNCGLDTSYFTTCYISHFNGILVKYPAVSTIILWTDGCGYQNK